MMLLPLGLPASATSLVALQQRGVQLGVPDGPPDPATAADFVLLEGRGGGHRHAAASAQRWREAKAGLRLVAVGLESVDDVERALASGIALAGGRLDAGNSGARPRPLQSAAHRICGLLNDLAMDRDTAAVAESRSSDVALSYRLLRYADGPGHWRLACGGNGGIGRHVSGPRRGGPLAFGDADVGSQRAAGLGGLARGSARPGSPDGAAGSRPGCPATAGVVHDRSLVPAFTCCCRCRWKRRWNHCA